MASPNGYMQSITLTRIDRSWAQAAVNYDINAAPWDAQDPQLGAYEFEVLISTSATGPWAPAQLTAAAAQCNVLPDNRLNIGTATRTVTGVGGPNVARPPLADTDYWARVILHNGQGVVLDDWVQGPFHTAPYPNSICAVAEDVDQTSATVQYLTDNGGKLNFAAPCNQDGITWDISTSPTGPWTSSNRELAQPAVQHPHQFVGLTPDTTYYYRARLDEMPGVGSAAGGEYEVTPVCSFKTLAVPVTTSPFNPQPCGTGGGGPDVENQILCDLDASGNLLGTALAVYEYDGSGNPVGAPTFIDPVTGNPYVVQGTLQVCPEAACLPPMQFCQTSTSTGPVDHPGRQYDITLPINPGFTVQSLTVDAVSHAAGITWKVTDTDGATFAMDLKNFIQGRIAGSTVTVTNPNAGSAVCGTAAAMQVHIECLRLDQSPPNLVELVYNGGVDKIINPAYAPYTSFTTEARRTDAGGQLYCTNVANRGWETNDVLNSFEFWGPANATPVGACTPTPRGTPIQEINANGSGLPSPNSGDTIWQTFTVSPAEDGSTFNVRVVVGGRVTTEAIRIRLFTGDPANPGATPADLIDTVVMAPKVAPPENNPWTTYSNNLPLAAGTYTLAFTGPDSTSFGGLFTDMRAYIDLPNVRATAVNDDTTCVVTTEETQTTTTCAFWQPQCVGGTVAGWERVDTGLKLTNAEFWAQTPSPKCCLPEPAAEGSGNGVKSNMLTSQLICGVVEGNRQTLIRAVVTDPSGGLLQEIIIGADGAPVTPTSWTPGDCSGLSTIVEDILCDVHDGITTTFRRATTYVADQLGSPVATHHRDFELTTDTVYTVQGVVGPCGVDTEVIQACDVLPDGTITPFLIEVLYSGDGTLITTRNTTQNGTPYAPLGTVTSCATVATTQEILCDRGNLDAATGRPHPFLRRYIGIGALAAAIDNELNGITPYGVSATANVGICDTAADPVATTGLCLPDGTPLAVVTTRDDNGAIQQEGWVNLRTGMFTAGLPPAAVIACGTPSSVQVSGTFCDVSGSTVNALVLIEYHYNPDGTIASVRLVNATTGATYTPVGTITTCPDTASQPDRDFAILCDVAANGTVTAFVRDYQRDSSGTVTGFSNYTLAGAAYTPTGTVGSCTGRDSESVILCDSAATPNRFVRTYTYDAAGAIQSFTDRTLAGAAFTPTGAVGICTTPTVADLDFVEQQLCDVSAAGVSTPFLRRFTIRSSDGVVTATQNLTLAGAAYTPTGTVGICADPCCPVTVAEVCLANGHPGVILRLADGTFQRTDTVTGAAFVAADIVSCTPTVNAQMRALADTQQWTPGGDVTGTLTSVTMTVISGTATVVDSNGTSTAALPTGYSHTWTNQLEGTLTGPQSITANGGTVVVGWTQK